MIPRRLEITNFLSYRETAELDFTGLHLACIAGMNGAGKSSILEAMTWALFGESRSKSDDDVVNRVATAEGGEARVVFEFELEEVDYRVIRRKKAGRTMVVELQTAVDAEVGQWKSLTGAKKKETDEAIIHLLGMNFATFRNASFLLQGQADEFTTKTPSQRKQILADLLGVNQWDVYRDAVAEVRKTAENELTILDAQVSDIEAELLTEESRKQAWEVAKAEHQRLKGEKEARELVLEQARKTADLITQQKQQVQSLRLAHQRAAHQLADWQATLAKRQAERAQHEAILAKGEAIQHAYAAWQTADESARAQQALADAHQGVVAQMRPFELAIAEARSKLAEQVQQLERQGALVGQMAAEREQLVPRLAEQAEEIAQLAADLGAITTAEGELQTARAALQAIQSERQLWQQEQSQWQKGAQEQAQLAAEADKLGKQKEQTAAQLAIAQQKLADLASQQERLAQLREEQSGLQAQQEILTEEGKKRNERIEKLKTADEADHCPLCGQPLTADHKAEVIAELEAEVASKRETYRHIRQRLPEIEKEAAELAKALGQRGVQEGQLQKLQQQLATAEARLAEIGRAQAGWAEGGGAERLAELGGWLADMSQLTARQNEVAGLEKRVAGRRPLEQKLQAAQKGHTTAEARLAEIERTVADWQAVGAGQLAATQAELASEGFAAEARAELATLQGQAVAIGYDPAAHQAARAELAKWQGAPQELRELERAQAAVAALDTGMATLTEQIGTQAEEVGQRQQELGVAEGVLGSLTAEGEPDVRVLEREVHKLREGEAEANRKVGMAWQNLAVLDDQRDRRAEKLAQREGITLRVARLKLLERACGRDGVQALLIEQALPEIEERANALLERLTGGRMRVDFETQREAKSVRKSIETLDIRITDEVGARPYENYSGGEQFRVNFALRIALSQMLAQRAGARLQTLVIDEGFGSQDPEGRQRLVEAIKAIQDDFRCVLVITHIAALQEAFPNQIEVFKSATGSRIRVS